MSSGDLKTDDRQDHQCQGGQKHLETLRPGPKILSRFKEVRSAVAPVWVASGDPLVLAARLLAHNGLCLTSGELIQRCGLELPPAEPPRQAGPPPVASAWALHTH